MSTYMTVLITWFAQSLFVYLDFLGICRSRHLGDTVRNLGVAGMITTATCIVLYYPKLRHTFFRVVPLKLIERISVAGTALVYMIMLGYSLYHAVYRGNVMPALLQSPEGPWLVIPMYLHLFMSGVHLTSHLVRLLWHRMDEANRESEDRQDEKSVSEPEVKTNTRQAISLLMCLISTWVGIAACIVTIRLIYSLDSFNPMSLTIICTSLLYTTALVNILDF